MLSWLFPNNSKACYFCPAPGKTGLFPHLCWPRLACTCYSSPWVFMMVQARSGCGMQWLQHRMLLWLWSLHPRWEQITDT
jgi:hypothetical protein